MKFRVLIEQDEDGVFVAQVPSLPGCISQCRSREEALRNAKNAMQEYIESLRKHNEAIPPSIQEEVVEIDAQALPCLRSAGGEDVAENWL